MSYKEMACQICGLPYSGWHNSQYCKRTGCRRLLRHVRYLQYDQPRRQAQPKTCRKCGIVVPKGKHLCKKCKHQGYLARQEEMIQILAQREKDKLIITNYEGMLPAMNALLEEAQEKNTEYRERIAMLESQLAQFQEALEVTNVQLNPKSINRCGIVYSTSRELEKYFNIRK